MASLVVHLQKALDKRHANQAAHLAELRRRRQLEQANRALATEGGQRSTMSGQSTSPRTEGKPAQ